MMRTLLASFWWTVQDTVYVVNDSSFAQLCYGYGQLLLIESRLFMC